MAADLESANEKAAISPVEQETKDNIVDWDGPDDPQNPRNWPTWKRMIQVVLSSLFLLTA